MMDPRRCGSKQVVGEMWALFGLSAFGAVFEKSAEHMMKMGSSGVGSPHIFSPEATPLRVLLSSSINLSGFSLSSPSPSSIYFTFNSFITLTNSNMSIPKTQTAVVFYEHK